jgi:p21-activated kinase 1
MPNLLEVDKQNNYHEISILGLVKHPNICEYFCSYQLETEVWVVMEFLEGGTLTDAVKRHVWKEKEIGFAAKQILKGVSYLHQNNLVHRDIKSANVMMTITGHIKLIDFGLCADVTKGPRTELVGSPLWIPPEMIRNEPHSFPADIWSAAICLLELANKEPPFNRQAIRCLYEVGTKGMEQPFNKPEEWSQSFKDFISSMVKLNQEERGTAAQLIKVSSFLFHLSN